MMDGYTERRFKFTDPMSGKTMRFNEFDTMTVDLNVESYIYDILTNEQIIKISKNVIEVYNKAFPILPKDFGFEVFVNVNRQKGLYDE